MINSFEDLNCWKIATELRRELAVLIKRFPKDEKYTLVDQIRRASRSVTNNIAEGFGRYHYQEFIQFSRISRGSLCELVDQMIISHDERYITDEELNYFKAKIERCKSLVNGLIRYLENAKHGIGKVGEPELKYYINLDHLSNYLDTESCNL